MSSNTILKPLIFKKNIGVKSVPTSSPKIPEFHFILAFAVEERKLNGKGTGKFSPSWNVKDFSAEKIIKLKSEYENVKVVISIGGRGVQYPFNPEDKKKWIDNAKKSLEKIIEHDYKSSTTEIVIDGIDITYERIKSDDFVECMAEVMKYLKMKGLKVSIALSSFPTYHFSHVFSIHKNLYRDNKDIIDWFDYKLYSLSQSYSFFVRRISARFSTDPNNTRNIPLDVFLKNCRKPKIQSLPIKKFGVQLASSSNFRTPQLLASKPTNPVNSSSNDTPSQTPKLQLKSPPKLQLKPLPKLQLKSPPKLQLKPLPKLQLKSPPKLQSPSKTEAIASKPKNPHTNPVILAAMANHPKRQNSQLKSTPKLRLKSTPTLQLKSSFTPKNQQAPSKPQVLASKLEKQPTNPFNSSSHGQPSQTPKLKLKSSFTPKNQ